AEGRWAGAPFPEARMTPAPQAPASAVVFNPWVKIARDGTVVVVIGQAEMGQGITTSLPMLVAEELGVPLERVATETAPADHIYDNPFIHEQMTVGSLSIRTNWERMRRAGAEVRERLIAAAAARWNVAAKECRAQEGEVVHTLSGRALCDHAHAAGHRRETRARRYGVGARHTGRARCCPYPERHRGGSRFFQLRHA